ncbi:MAG: hypothetical protein HYW25_03855 [Candidatus Aenigmarchaeota archaeon]|nr:hypothetical protein [Candidatus Aenigmarchaeota archaeon]
MVRLERYGPVLDPVIEVAKELAESGEAELYVPMHPQAAGMAVDAREVLARLYPFTDLRVYFPGATRFSPYSGKSDEKARRLKVSLVFDDGRFETRNQERFASYPRVTIIDVEDDEDAGFKSRISVQARGRAPDKRPEFAAFLDGNAIETPRRMHATTITLAYQSISHFPVDTCFQHFPLIEREWRPKAGDEVLHYPVSEREMHRLPRKAWDFFNAPVFWDSWSQFGSLALNKMAGVRSYEDAARYHSYDVEDILRRAKRAEESVAGIIDVLRRGEDPGKVADRVGCPYEYRGFYLHKILNSIRWLCNPDSLGDAEKAGYLANLSQACREHGLEMTPEGLAAI